MATSSTTSTGCRMSLRVGGTLTLIPLAPPSMSTASAGPSCIFVHRLQISCSSIYKSKRTATGGRAEEQEQERQSVCATKGAQGCTPHPWKISAWGARSSARVTRPIAAAAGIILTNAAWDRRNTRNTCRPIHPCTVHGMMPQVNGQTTHGLCVLGARDKRDTLVLVPAVTARMLLLHHAHCLAHASTARHGTTEHSQDPGPKFAPWFLTDLCGRQQGARWDTWNISPPV